MTTTKLAYSLKDPQKARQALVDLFHALTGETVIRNLPNPTERPVTLELDGVRIRRPRQ